MQTQIIIDLNGKQRIIKNNPKIITHTYSNAYIEHVRDVVDGELVDQPKLMEVETDKKFVEVVIIGRNREWVEWYDLEEFEKQNPSVDISI